MSRIRTYWSYPTGWLSSICLLIWVCTLAGSVHAQQASRAALAEIYTAFDSIVGEENLELFYGPVFRPEAAPNPDSHAYFLQDGYLRGDVVFDGQKYYGQKLKYHLYLDELLISPKFNNSALLVQLAKDLVSEFEVSGHRFIQFYPEEGEEAMGFLEVMAEKDGHMLMKKHRKNRSRSRQGSTISFRYQKRTSYFIYTQDKLIPIDSRTQWNRGFEGAYKDLGSFYRDRYREYRNDKDRFFTELFNEFLNRAGQ
jgi:hypothetical protein